MRLLCLTIIALLFSQRSIAANGGIFSGYKADGTRSFIGKLTGRGKSREVDSRTGKKATKSTGVLTAAHGAVSPSGTHLKHESTEFDETQYHAVMAQMQSETAALRALNKANAPRARELEQKAQAQLHVAQDRSRALGGQRNEQSDEELYQNFMNENH